MATPPADERTQVLAAATTPQEGPFMLTWQEWALVRAIEDVQHQARALGVDVSEALAPRKLRTDAFLWRAHQRMAQLERYLEWLKR